MSPVSPTTIRVNLKERGYDIVMATESAPGLGPFTRERVQGTNAVLITDQNVAELAKRAQIELQSVGFQTLLKVLPSGEEQKSLSVASELYDWLADSQVN